MDKPLLLRVDSKTTDKPMEKVRVINLESPINVSNPFFFLVHIVSRASPWLIQIRSTSYILRPRLSSISHLPLIPTSVSMLVILLTFFYFFGKNPFDLVTEEERVESGLWASSMGHLNTIIRPVDIRFGLWWSTREFWIYLSRRAPPCKKILFGWVGGLNRIWTV